MDPKKWLIKPVPLVMASVFFFVIVFFSLACQSEVEKPVDIVSQSTFTLADLQADFKVLKDIIENRHPKLYTDQARLQDLLNQQYTLISEGMTELEFLRLLTPIVSALNCGHTAIMPSDDYQNHLDQSAVYFPLPLYFVKDHAYIVGNATNENIPVGSELISIEGLSIVDIKRQLFSNMTSDGQNTTFKLRLLNGWFRYFYQNIIASQSEYHITYKTEGSSKLLKATLKGVLDRDYERLNGSQNLDANEAYSSIFKPNYALLTMRSFYPEGIHTIAAYKTFIDDFFLKVKEQNIGHLILDVRNNGGGDPYITSYLFSYLAKSEQPYFAPTAISYYAGLKDVVPLAQNHYEGQLYTLMNGGSFSSTGHLLALLKYQDRGVFIGEESGGSFACTDGSQSATLPKTKIQYRGSTLLWEVAVNGLTPARGILPDYEVVQSVQDYLDHKDPVLAFAIDLLSR